MNQENCSDLDNAIRLVRAHGHVLMYVPRFGWYTWNGRFWEPDEIGNVVRKAKDIPLRMCAQLAEIADSRKREQLGDLR